MVACNTASTLVLAPLREKFQVPFVGTVPAIKPACSSSNSRLVSVLGTEATVKREYTRKLIREHGNDCALTLVGSPRLAELAEAALKGETVTDDEIAAEIAPCFVEADGARTDTVVLACTHYPLLLDRLETARGLAGEMARSGPGHRPPGGGSAGSAGAGRRFAAGPRRFHLRPAARAHAGRGAGPFRARRNSFNRCLTPPANTPKNRPSRGPFWPARCFATRGFASFRKDFALWLQNLSVPVEYRDKGGRDPQT